MSFRRWAALLAVGALAAGGCGAAPGGCADPPDARPVARDGLPSAMRALAAEVDALDALMRDPAPIDAERRARVLERLVAIERAVGAIAPREWRARHPRIQANLDAFRGDIALALEGVESEPPEYFFAGSLAGACTYCHGD